MTPNGIAHESVQLGFALDRRFVDGLFGSLDDPSVNAALRTPGLITDFDQVDPALLASLRVLVTGWGCPPLDRTALDRMPALQAVIHSAGSVKGIVTDECWRRRVIVSSQADANAVPVAEFTVAAIVFAGKRAFGLHWQYDRRRSQWNSRELPLDMGNFRRTIGVVGASRIGRRVIRLLRDYDVSVLVADPFLGADDARLLGAELVTLDELCRRSHVITLHAPALPSTYRMIDAGRLALMRDGATLINTARGTLIDHEALAAEASTGRINAVLDHTDPLILPDDSPLFDNPGVWITPHIAGSLGNELGRLGGSAMREVGRFLRGEPFAHPVFESDLERTA